MNRSIELDIDEYFIAADHYQGKHFEVLFKGQKINNARGVILKGVGVIYEKETTTG